MAEGRLVTVRFTRRKREDVRTVNAPVWKRAEDTPQSPGMGQSLPVPPLQFPGALPQHRGGYERGATEEVFATLASSYETLWVTCDRLQEQVTELQKELDYYREGERLVGEALLEAKRSAAAAKDVMRREAEALLKKARTKADQIIENAKREARTIAETDLSEVKEEWARVEKEMERLRAFAKEAQQVKDGARVEAEALVNKAQTNADQIVEDAERKARAMAEKDLSDVREERARVEEEMERLRAFANETQQDLSSLLFAALKWQKRSVGENLVSDAEGSGVVLAEALETVLESESEANEQLG
jgi:cell division septum initiation protein DivIVA